MSIELITKRFDEVFDLSLGRTPSRGDKSYWGGNHTWVSIADMSCGKYISSSKECITDKALVDTGIPLVRKGTVIMSFKLSIGKVCIANKDLYTNEAIMAFSLNGKYNILPDYLYYYLRAYKWNVSNEVVLGFTLNKKNISNSLITFPVSVSEQQRIVDILDKEFAKVEALKANAENSFQAATELFQATLKKELSPRAAWKRMALGEFAHMKAGDFIKASDIHEKYYEGSYPCYGGNGLRGYVDEPNRDGDFCLIGRQGALCGNVHMVSGVFRATEHAVVVTPYKPIPTRLVYYLLVSLDLNKFSTGAAQPGLSVKNIAENAFISIPPDSEWENIIKTLDTLSEDVSSLQKNYTKTCTLCEDLKLSLLRKAFNGEL